MRGVVAIRRVTGQQRFTRCSLSVLVHDFGPLQSLKGFQRALLLTLFDQTLPLMGLML